MKKYTPYIFPLVVLSVVFLLVFRWYSMRTARLEKDSFAEGVEIENLSEEELSKSISGVGDYDSIELSSDFEDSTGVVRYEIKDGKIRFSVMANFPESDQDYKVWLKEANGEAMREVFALTSSKGGYIGSAAIPAELLPFEVIVTGGEAKPENVLKEVILRGTIQKESASQVELK